MSRPWRRGVALLVALLPVAGCNAQFRFDDHSIPTGDTGVTRHDDAAADVALAPDLPGADGAMDASAGGFTMQRCGRTSCKLECPHDSTCAGACGASCNVDCEEHSRCELVTGAGAQVRCETEAICQIDVGPGSQVICDPRSRCVIRCFGACSTNCENGATCAIACGANAAPAPFTDTATCG